MYKARVHEAALQELLEKLRAGELTTAEVTSRLRAASLERVADLARIDLHRELRVGAPEIVYGESKTAEQIASIMLALDGDGCGAFATRVDADKARGCITAMGQGEYDALSCTLVIPARQSRPSRPGTIGVVCAGTSDLPVAEEAALSLEFLGQTVCRVRDIGVAVAIEDGLITPVVRAADQKSLSEIAGEVREMAERARARVALTGLTVAEIRISVTGLITGSNPTDRVRP